ncbi:unnamed protein product [Effrenium voratum]|uniref:Uncharacterized protein n=1 Tax=Effrenium voratum TaxID=2562239 RepID=A0AA36NIV7_9DINO|nr:unnamed protein product [Effrenium voratum]
MSGSRSGDSMEGVVLVPPCSHVDRIRGSHGQRCAGEEDRRPASNADPRPPDECWHFGLRLWLLCHLFQQGGQRQTAQHELAREARRLVVMVFTVIMAVAGKIALDPSMGMLRTAKEVRKMHRYSGRIMLVAAWVCSIMGWYTFQKMAILPVAIFALPLLAFVKVMM